MHCKSCEILIKDSLEDLGVKTIFNNNIATIEFGESIKLEEIKKIIEKEGYKIK